MNILKMYAIIMATTFAQILYANQFAVPIHDSTVEWEVSQVLASNAPGHFGGPAMEAGWHMATGGDGGCYSGHTSGASGNFFWAWYDPQKKRVHQIAGGAIGHLDGPFGVARFGIWDYTNKKSSALSPCGRYRVLNDNWSNLKYLRVLDFQTQEVRTIVSDIVSSNAFGLDFDSSGNIYLMTSRNINNGTQSVCSLTILTIDGIIVQKMALETTVGKINGTKYLPMALDEKNNRLYCGQTIQNWYLFYWDLANGSFNGVMPRTDSLRLRNKPGPFEGMNFYPEACVIKFGPDDPEKRFLYYTHIDTRQLHRIDLKEKIVAALLPTVKDGKTTVKFSYEFFGSVNVYGAFDWVESGHDFVSREHTPTRNFLFRRIK